MSDLPIGWALAKVRDLTDLNPKNSDITDDTIAGFVPMTMLGKDYRSGVAHDPRPWAGIKKGYTHFRNGDVLLAKITPCFENGKAGLVSGMPNGVGAGSTEYFVNRPHAELVDSRYLLALFKTEAFLREGALQMTGSVGHKRVPREYLSEASISLAPRNEQTRIADKLDAVLARVDACRDRLDRIPVILKRFRQSVLAAATSGKLTEEWRTDTGCLSEWQKVCLNDVIVDMRNGMAPKPTETPPGAKILRISAVRSGRLDLADHRYLVVTDKDASQYSLQKHDLLFTRYNGSLEFVGVCASLKHDAKGYVYPDKLIRVRVKESMAHSEFIEVVFGSEPVRRQIENFIKSSAGQKGISGADLKSTRFTLPSLSEQTEIVHRVEALFAFADRLEARYTAARVQVEKLTPSLLAKAFRGELVPQDPNDESASALLERIRTQRGDKSISKGKRGRDADPLVAKQRK